MPAWVRQKICSLARNKISKLTLPAKESLGHWTVLNTCARWPLQQPLSLGPWAWLFASDLFAPPLFTVQVSLSFCPFRVPSFLPPLTPSSQPPFYFSGASTPTGMRETPLPFKDSANSCPPLEAKEGTPSQQGVGASCMEPKKGVRWGFGCNGGDCTSLLSGSWIEESERGRSNLVLDCGASAQPSGCPVTLAAWSYL